MVQSYKQSDNINPYVTELVADSIADIASLSTTSYGPGSTCIVLEDSSVYVLSPSRTWVKLG